ncbi:hypothetical protein FBULB1_11268 [Fusarium bulbicola]|nr:hypothetical protein FBULB1_11268 [Fusarium bulbicola]
MWLISSTKFWCSYFLVQHAPLPLRLPNAQGNKSNKSEDNIGDGEGEGDDDNDTTNESRFKSLDADKMLKLAYDTATKAMGPLPAQELPACQIGSAIVWTGSHTKDIESILRGLSPEMSHDTMQRSSKQVNLISVLELDAVLQEVLTMLVAEHEGYQNLGDALVASFEEEETGDTGNDDQ